MYIGKTIIKSDHIRITLLIKCCAGDISPSGLIGITRPILSHVEEIAIGVS